MKSSFDEPESPTQECATGDSEAGDERASEAKTSGNVLISLFVSVTDMSVEFRLTGVMARKEIPVFAADFPIFGPRVCASGWE